MLTKETTQQLLGRSLTSTEDTNFKLYLNIAVARLEELLCMNLTSDASTRTYEPRSGYRTLFIDPFTQLNSVTVDGNIVASTDYVVKQWDNRNASWYNTIVFDDGITGDVVVNADWGFDGCPVDLRLLLAKLFDQHSKEQGSNNVKSKKIEDFTVTYKDAPTLDEVVSENASVINKYRLCNQGAIRHGSVSTLYHN